jgi:AcrR family transcriptional regulator
MSIHAPHSPYVAPPHHPLRRRGETLERAIFDAVLNELCEGGYEAVTMEGVAARAHTGKAALYRRWESKAHLVVDVIEHCLLPLVDPPDTGSVRNDLFVMLKRLAALFNSPAGSCVSTMTSNRTHDRTFRDLCQERVVEPHRRAQLEVFQRGIERGEVRTDVPLDLVAEIGPSLILKHFLADGPPVPNAFVASIVDELLMPILRRRDC